MEKNSENSKINARINKLSKKKLKKRLFLKSNFLKKIITIPTLKT